MHTSSKKLSNINNNFLFSSINSQNTINQIFSRNNSNLQNTKSTKTIFEYQKRSRNNENPITILSQQKSSDSLINTNQKNWEKNNPNLLTLISKNSKNNSTKNYNVFLKKNSRLNTNIVHNGLISTSETDNNKNADTLDSYRDKKLNLKQMFLNRKYSSQLSKIAENEKKKIVNKKTENKTLINSDTFNNLNQHFNKLHTVIHRPASKEEKRKKSIVFSPVRHKTIEFHSPSIKKINQAKLIKEPLYKLVNLKEDKDNTNFLKRNSIFLKNFTFLFNDPTVLFEKLQEIDNMKPEDYSDFDDYENNNKNKNNDDNDNDINMNNIFKNKEKLFYLNKEKEEAKLEEIIPTIIVDNEELYGNGNKKLDKHFIKKFKNIKRQSKTIRLTYKSELLVKSKILIKEKVEKQIDELELQYDKKPIFYNCEDEITKFQLRSLYKIDENLIKFYERFKKNNIVFIYKKGKILNTGFAFYLREKYFHFNFYSKNVQKFFITSKTLTKRESNSERHSSNNFLKNFALKKFANKASIKFRVLSNIANFDKYCFKYINNFLYLDIIFDKKNKPMVFYREWKKKLSFYVKTNPNNRPKKEQYKRSQSRKYYGRRNSNASNFLLNIQLKLKEYDLSIKKIHTYYHHSILTRKFFKRKKPNSANTSPIRDIFNEKKIIKKIPVFESFKTFVTKYKKQESLINNKFHTLIKTREIKEEITQAFKTEQERLVYSIKDSNFTLFKSIYEKFFTDPDIEDKDGNTLLSLAVQANCFQIVDYLLNAGADLNISNVRIYLFF